MSNVAGPRPSVNSAKKRIRTVHGNGMVAHLWAHESQQHARNSKGTLFFRDNTIFSYGEHFAIARIVRSGQQVAVLFNSRRYSVTTSQHQNMAWSAAQHISPKFTVPSVHGRGRWDDEINHDENLAHYRTAIDNTALKLCRSRKYKDYAASHLESLVNEANEYATFFGLPQRFAAPSDEAVTKAIRESRDAERKRAEEEQHRRAEALEHAKEAIAKWKAGEDIRLPWAVHEVFLRVKGNVMQTSKGAEVPLAHAVRLLPLIRSGTAYKHNGHTEHVGHFRIDEVDKQGNVRVGCHFIKREEIERIATQLGL